MEGVDKILAIVGGRAIIARSIAAMEAAAEVDDVAVVVRDDQIEAVRRLCARETWRKVRAVVPGGARRQDSVAAGLLALPAAAWIVIHDGARPFATADLVERCARAARETGAAIAAYRMTDTVKRVREGSIGETLDRAELWGAQTPQVFRRDVLERAGELATRKALSVTDESTLAEMLGVAVRVVESSPRNMKVTTREDLDMATRLAEPWRSR